MRHTAKVISKIYEQFLDYPFQVDSKMSLAFGIEFANVF